MNMMVLQIGKFVQKPEWWRLVTSVFLHFGWDHLFNNMLVLLYLGALAERCLGKWRFLGVYLISGIGANAASVWWYVHQGGFCSWQQPVHLVQFLESQVFYYVLFYCQKVILKKLRFGSLFS